MSLPGGTLEKGESYLECAIREVYEESAVRLKKQDVKSLFYQSNFQKEGGDWKLQNDQLRYLCTKYEVEEFIEDHAGGVEYQRWIGFGEVHDFLKWGNTSRWMKDYLVNSFA